MKKRANVLIKYINFCKINRNDPLSIKLNVLDKCVTSVLLYASETWGGNFHEVEIVYRYGIKTALGIRQNVNNEITNIESNRFPLECKIRKNQMKFWINVDYVYFRTP